MRTTRFFSILTLLLLFVPSVVKGQPVSESVHVENTPVVNVEEKTSGTPADSDSSVDYDEPEWQKVTILGVEMDWNGYTVRESGTEMDPETVTFADLGGDRFFPTVYPVTTESYILAEGEFGETTCFHIHSENPGATIYVVAGVHGDERAAWYAGIMLKKATIANGDLYIVAPANSQGAKLRKRYVTKQQDLNRSFPGDANGNEAERVAHAIYSDIERIQPDFVFDLHEAIVYTAGRDFLGSTYIFTELDRMEDLFFDLLWATEEGELCHNEFAYTGPGPKGSINSTVTLGLGIPVITVETFRGFDIERRVYDQLDTVQFTLRHYGMLED